MVAWIYCCTLCCITLVSCLDADPCENKYNTYYETSGDVYITGLFHVHKGFNCSSSVTASMQQMTDLAIIIDLLNNVQYISGMTIGVMLYDICSVKDSANKALISSLMDSDCKPAHNLGILTPKDIFQGITNLSTTLKIPAFELATSIHSNLFFKIANHLLIELRYTSLDLVVMPNMETLIEFAKLATSEGICIKQSLLLSQFNGICLDKKSVIFVAITSAEINVLSKINVNCSSRFIIGLMDSNADFTKLSDHLPINDAYTIIPSNVWIEPIIPLEDDFASSLKIVQESIYYLNISLDFLQTASSIIAILDSFKQNMGHCSDNSTLSECVSTDSTQTFNFTQQQLLDVIKILNLDVKNLLGYIVLHVDRQTVSPVAESKLKNGHWMLEFNSGIEKNLQKELTLCNFQVDSPVCGDCSNKKLLTDGETAYNFFTNFPFCWKSEIWIPSILTLCTIGAVSSICILVFIVGRIRRDDILEGNSCPTILLALGTIIMYATVVPFCMNLTSPQSHYASLQCAYKLFGSTLSYSIVFSIILSRTLMILTSDFEGSFMSHINGYLQSFLCFFMLLVQTSLITQFAFVNSYLLDKDYCPKLMDGNAFLLNMSYNGFLLLCLLLTVPFIANSKRNYREGLCFAVASFCIMAIWIFWCVLYVISDHRWKDFSVAFGLTTTASTIVICVFIPRSYLIMNGIVRDQITSALPSFNYTANPNITKYRSNQALYDTVNAEISPKGESNLAYHFNPQNPTDIAQESTADTGVPHENNYENYVRPNDIGNSKITKF